MGKRGTIFWFVLLAAGLAGLPVPRAKAGPDVCGCWTPQPGQIAELETQLHRDHRLPADVDRYARTYAGGINGNITFIRGHLVPLAPGEVSAVHVIAGQKMPPLQGEGCITGYDLKLAATFVSCAAPGAWTPGGSQVAALEGNVILPPGTPPLAAFARNYAGVTLSGRRFIQAVYVRDSKAPGIFVASEAELPSFLEEGGCDVIHLRYDPALARVVEMTCNAD